MAKQDGGQPTLGSAPPQRPSARVRNAVSDARKASSADQLVADAEQSASDTNQVSSDIDQTASDRDQAGAARDQQASDQDPATADRDRAAHRLIGVEIEADAGVGISVGFAELEPGDTADGLTERADAAMLGVKAAHRARS